MFGDNYMWNYDYVRLACESGFSFQRYPPHSFDKNKISLIDVDRIIEEKDLATVEKYIPCVCHFVLDPEQAKILDDNFVKVFRLCQLVIEYLLFCKKYLDNTVTEVKVQIDKTKKENKELSLFVEDLQQHISVLMKEIKEQKAISLFSCEHCNKKFSSEEFLNSHIKRRHINAISPLNTDKLHMEIKELKGRLNSTEKLIQQEQNNLKPGHDMELDHRINEWKKIDELQQKFEDLRVQVQSELKVLQTQYNFQEKYEKLIEKITFMNLPENKHEPRLIEKRRESTTQTEKEKDFKKVEIAIKNNTEHQITEFKEALEVKVTTSLEKIENHMQSFWNKLHEMEIPRPFIQENQQPPSVKPRSKYTLKDSPQSVKKLFHQHKNNEEEEQIDELPEAEQSKILQVSQQAAEESSVMSEETTSESPNKEKNREKPTFFNVSLPETDITSSATSEKPVVNKFQQKSLTMITKKPSLKGNNATKKLEVNANLFDHFRAEVENIMVMGRLQDLGVSPEWKGLPTHSFQRALEIVNHKASLMKKTYPDFDQISSKIEIDVNKKMEQVFQEKNRKNREKGKSISVGKKSKVPHAIEIQNKTMYETDSDSDPVRISKVKDNLKEISTPSYSAVIEELKAVTTKFDQSVSEVNSIQEEIVKNEETKGVLKNYRSVGSLTKKRVLFNLYNNDSYKKKNKEDESTTSITSSILDGSPRKRDAKLKENNIEDLSDFDFSDV